MNYIHGIIHPIPFSDDPNSGRATKTIILILLCLMISLKIIFKKSEAEAVNIMLMVHEKGSGVCGVFTKEIAETKVNTVVNMAKKDQHPLKILPFH